MNVTRIVICVAIAAVGACKTHKAPGADHTRVQRTAATQEKAFPVTFSAGSFDVTVSSLKSAAWKKGVWLVQADVAAKNHAAKKARFSPGEFSTDLKPAPQSASLGTLLTLDIDPKSSVHGTVSMLVMSDAAPAGPRVG